MELEQLELHNDENIEAKAKNEWNSDDETSVESPEDRPRWGSRCEFLLAIIGYTVGIGNVWRFPVLCARNGGGAFLIPFFFFMLTCGGPLYYIEVCLGQFSGKAAGKAFEFCPLLKVKRDQYPHITQIMARDVKQRKTSADNGYVIPRIPIIATAERFSKSIMTCEMKMIVGLGYLMVVISFNMIWYYITILGWIQYYLVHSFFAELPWSTCGNWWNTDNCRVTFGESANLTVQTRNATDGNRTVYGSNSLDATLYTSPALEFWEHNVLRKSTGLEDMGSVQIHLAVSAFIGWVFIVAALIKGVQSLGKVVYVTALAPYVLLTILLIRGLTLDGSVDGIVWYSTPDFEKLASPQVWLDAAIQVFYSLGPSYGGVITMASHNKFHQKSIVETAICVASDAFTAFYAGFVVFACIGFMAHEAGISVEEIAKYSGPGLAFVAYPQAITKMPLPQLWAVLFFLMLTTVLFDSAFSMLETVTGTIIDMFPYFFRKRQWIVLVGVSLFLYLIGLPFYTNGGIYMFQLADWYVTVFALLLGSFIESTTINWIYGADRFARDIELMTSRKVSVLMRINWCLILTSFLCIAFGITVVSYREPDYGDSYVYQPYAIRIGLFLSVLPIIPFVGIMLKEVYFAKGSLIQRIRTLLRPSELWVPHDERAKEIYRLKPYRYEDTIFRRIRKDLFGDKETPWI